MKHIWSMMSFAGLLLLSINAQAQENISDLYSTGVDDAGAPIALNASDTHWEVQESALGWNTPIYEKNNYCASCGNIWIDHPLGDNTISRPITHPSHIRSRNATNRKFSWRTSFTLPATADPATATISYKVGYDDLSRNETDTGNLTGCNHTVWLNGTAYPMTSTGNNVRTECTATIPAGSNFVVGNNTLEFRIWNAPTYYGFRWEKVSATYETAIKNILDLYSTGVDDAAAPIALGATDTHWEVQESALGWNAPIYEKNNYCSSCGNIWIDHPLGNNAISRPITHPSHIRSRNATNRKFSWRTSFTLPATADPATATISYKVGYDDLSRNETDTGNLTGCNHTVWLNGTAYPMTSTGNNVRTECTATIPAGSNFVVGNNTLEFRIWNAPTYYGFRWEKIEATFVEAQAEPVVVTLKTPFDGQVTNDNTPEISGTATAGAMMALEIKDAQGNVVSVLNPTVDAQGNYIIDAVMLVDGVYTVTASATDGTTTANAGPHTFTVDTVGPTISVTAPTVDQVSNDNTPTISGTTDPDVVVTIIIKDNAGAEVETLTATADAQGAFSVDAAMLADGEFTVELSGADDAGNTTTEGPISFTIDTSAPDVAITSPTNDETVDNATPAISGTATPASVVNVVVTDDANMVVFDGNVTADAQGNWTITPATDLANGVYTIAAKATNTAGTSADATPVIFTVNVMDNNDMVSITSPANDAELSDSTPTITGTATPGATVTILVDGQDAGTATADDQGNWSYDIASDLSEGAHTVEAKVNEVSDSVSFTIKPEGQTAPVVITSPAAGASIDGTSVSVEGTGEPGTEVTVSVDGQSTTVTVDSDGQWTASFEDVTKGDHVLTAKGDDMVDVDVTITVKGDDDSNGNNNGNNGNTNTASEGCNCSSSESSPVSGLWLLGMIGLLGLRRRRRHAV